MSAQTGSKKRDEQLKALVAECQALLAIIREYQFLFAGGVFVLSTVAVNNYFSHENIPLSVASSEVTAALPAVFTLMVGMILLLGSLLGAPVVLLLASEKMGPHESVARSPGCPTCHPCPGDTWGAWLKRAKWLLICWTFFSGICFALISWLPDMGWNLTLVFLLSVVLLALAMSVVLCLARASQSREAGRPNEGNEPDKEKKACFLAGLVLRCLGASFLQTLVLIGLYVFLWNRRLSHYEIFWSIVVMAILQFLLVGIVWQGVQEGKRLTRLFGLALVAVVVIALVPYYGPFFVSNVLARQAMGGRDCVVLRWSPGARVLPELIDGGVIHGKTHSITSKPLRVLFSSSSNVYVRPKAQWDSQRWGDSVPQPTYLVPQGAIAGYSSCPQKK